MFVVVGILVLCTCVESGASGHYQFVANRSSSYPGDLFLVFPLHIAEGCWLHCVQIQGGREGLVCDVIAGDV
ncbi:hypothetical protein M758_1G218300 [Ceratodon purpureus]|uniref:Secreted protein n=1 Tax=Ceratodon purpureus TaxID=3225 RepID=A0A8T0JAN5_CERPU|nr:hypothetical protein KC19_1G201500 [Ceratodon purpureus]KAG0630981.1 hypothetical protein M758_1G218300 [Ceratodon purpureus]